MASGAPIVQPEPGQPLRRPGVPSSVAMLPLNPATGDGPTSCSEPSSATFPPVLAVAPACAHSRPSATPRSFVGYSRSSGSRPRSPTRVYPGPLLPAPLPSSSASPPECAPWIQRPVRLIAQLPHPRPWRVHRRAGPVPSEVSALRAVSFLLTGSSSAPYPGRGRRAISCRSEPGRPGGRPEEASYVCYAFPILPAAHA